MTMVQIGGIDVYKRQVQADEAPAPRHHRIFPDRQRSGERPDTGL